MTLRSFFPLFGAAILVSALHVRAAEVAETPARAMEVSGPSAGAVDAPLLAPSALPVSSLSTDLSARSLEAVSALASQAGPAAAAGPETTSQAAPVASPSSSASSRECFPSAPR